jgi:DNA-binding FadR family transcriptional regulator
MMLASQEGDVGRFVECDLEFHRLLCHMADDPYLEKCLRSVMTPLFAFVLIRLKQNPGKLDLVEVSGRHQQIVEVLSLPDPAIAREKVPALIDSFQETVLETLYGIDERNA